jgi:hypothetical protein
MQRAVQRVKRHSEALVDFLIDGAFLVCWAAIHGAIDWALKLIDLTGVDRYIVQGLQITFALATLGYIISFLIEDVRVAVRENLSSTRRTAHEKPSLDTSP